MDVLHGLACRLAVVLEDVEAVAGKRFLDVGRDLLDACDDGGKRRVGRIEKPFRVFLWNHEDMTLREWIDVEVGENDIVLVDLEARNLACGDRAENAVVLHASIIPYRRRSCLPLAMDGCYLLMHCAGLPSSVRLAS